MLSADKTYSGVELKFMHNVDLINVLAPGDDGKVISFTPSQVAVARMGENGFVTTLEDVKFEGGVQFMVGTVNQIQEKQFPTVPVEPEVSSSIPPSKIKRVGTPPFGFDYPELRDPIREQSVIERLEAEMDNSGAKPLIVVEETRYDEDGLRIEPEDRVELTIAEETVFGRQPEKRSRRVQAAIDIIPIVGDTSDPHVLAEVLRANAKVAHSALNGSAKADQPGPQNHSAQSVPQGFAPDVLRLVRERGDSYGSPAENHQLTADLWSAWLSRRLRYVIVLTAEDVCMLNVLQKESRLAFKTKDDSWFDVAGYTENVAMLRPDQRNV